MRAFYRMRAISLVRRIRPEWVVVGAMVLYAAYFSAYSVQRHFAFQTYGYDLSFYAQSLWNTLHGRFMRLTAWPGEDSFFRAIHFAPSLLLILPLYAVWTSPSCLLVVQSVALASGAWPVFHLSNRHLQKSWLAAGYAVVYLLFPALQAANLFDFHELTLAAPLLIWLWYLAQRNRWAIFGLIAVVAIGFREEFVATLAVMGFLLSRKRQSRKAGHLIILASIIWGVVVVGLTFGRTTALGSRVLPRLGLGSDPVEVLENFFLHPIQTWNTVARPEKVLYLLHLFAPVGYLAVFAPEVLLLASPTLGINLLGNWASLHSPTEFHYSVTLPAFVVLAAAGGSARLASFLAKHTRFSSKSVQVILCVYVGLLSLGYHLKLNYLPYSPHFRWPEVDAHACLGQEIVRQIPSEASVSAQNPLAPHVCHRQTLYIFPVVQDADYIFLDLSRRVSLQPDGHDEVVLREQVQSWLSGSRYRTVMDRDGYLLLEREDVE